MAGRIQNLRKSRGISQEELAEQLGVSRQAVSKWESGQSAPDIEKVILLSDFFEVTADYLLRGIEPASENTAGRQDARILSLVGTALNFIGLVAAIMIWSEEQTPISIAVGLILMAVGTMIFAIGQFTGESREKAALGFWLVNVWILSLMPISCAFHFLHGLVYRCSWTFAPIPQPGNSIVLYGGCWGFYLCFSIAADLLLLKRLKR